MVLHKDIMTQLGLFIHALSVYAFAWSGVQLWGRFSNLKPMVYIKAPQQRLFQSKSYLRVLDHDGCLALVSIIKWHELQCLTDCRDERYSMYVHDTCKQESVKAVHKCSIGETPSL